jgi:hypothetical protein
MMIANDRCLQEVGGVLQSDERNPGWIGKTSHLEFKAALPDDLPEGSKRSKPAAFDNAPYRCQAQLGPLQWQTLEYVRLRGPMGGRNRTDDAWSMAHSSALNRELVVLTVDSRRTLL